MSTSEYRRQYMIEYARRYYRLHKNEVEFKNKQREHWRKRQLKIRDLEHERKRMADWQAEYRRTHPEVVVKLASEWCSKNPEKHKAHTILTGAIRLGKIVRPSSCQKCGCIPPPSRNGSSRIQGHHEDYSKPLEVQWLCAFCHGNTRRKH